MPYVPSGGTRNRGRIRITIRKRYRMSQEERSIFW
jgi:hypothetical protein